MSKENKAVAAVLLLIVISVCSFGLGFMYHGQQKPQTEYVYIPVVEEVRFGIWFKQYTDGPRVYCNATIYAIDENNTIHHGKTISDLWGSYDGWSTSGYKNLRPFTNWTFCLSIYVNNTSWNTTDGTYYEVNKTLIVGGNMVISVWHTGFTHYGYLIMSSLMGTEWWNE